MNRWVVSFMVIGHLTPYLWGFEHFFAVCERQRRSGGDFAAPLKNQPPRIEVVVPHIDQIPLVAIAPTAHHSDVAGFVGQIGVLTQGHDVVKRDICTEHFPVAVTTHMIKQCEHLGSEGSPLLCCVEVLLGAHCSPTVAM